MTVSVVSHGHETEVAALLGQLAAQPALVAHVILTHNLPAQALAPPATGWPFRLTEVFNERPAGFATNHNRAFALCESALFCVLNPDIDLQDPGVLERLVASLAQPGVGLAYPLLVNPDGSPQNERELVTPWTLVRRHLLRLPGRRIDWVNGAFWLVPSAVWREVGGLDERYHMYCEDTDFCLRVQLSGLRLARAETRAVHAAAWGSRRPGRAMAWHVRSLWRLWTGAAYRDWRARERQRPAGAQ